MAHLHINHQNEKLDAVRQQARQSGHMQNAQMVLVAAGIAAAGIMAVAASMMTTLL